MAEERVPEVPESMNRVCAVCGEETEGEYFRVGHLLSPHKLAVCKECFDGRETWMHLADRYFADYVDHYKEMEEEVRQHYEDKENPPGRNE